MTFEDMKSQLMDEIWPSGYPENNLPSINGYFVSAMMALQRDIRCLQVKNVSKFEFCATYYRNGMTWVDKPKRSQITRVWAIANNDHSTRVSYHGSTIDKVEALAKDSYPIASEAAVSAFGDQYASDETDAAERSRTGLFTIEENGRVTLAPWIQSNETIFIEWNGIKADWEDSDEIDEEVWTREHLDAIRDFVLWQYNARFGDGGLDIKQLFDDKRAELMLDCEKELRVRKEGHHNNYTPDGAQFTAEQLPE